ncbi:type III pantothenate kinase [soil metagenome]
MLLLVDAGNSRIKWALAEASANGKLGAWAEYGSIETGEVAQLAPVWDQRSRPRDSPISRILVSNVAGQGLRKELEQVLQAASDLQSVPVCWFASAPAAGGIRNGYRNPAQLGCDRLAAAIGAHALFPQEALIVASCGTATTIDAITADGIFLGGMILPGLSLMTRSLAAHTAQLPQVSLDVKALPPFADNTEDAIASGCMAAQAGAIERSLAVHARNSHGARCVLSGGAASALVSQLSVACSQVDNLVLVGLQVLGQQQQVA